MVEFIINGIGDGDIQSEERRFFEIDHNLGIDFFLSGKYDEERHKKYDEGLSSKIVLTVDSHNRIIEIEWFDKMKN